MKLSNVFSYVGVASTVNLGRLVQYCAELLRCVCKCPSASLSVCGGSILKRTELLLGTRELELTALFCTECNKLVSFTRFKRHVVNGALNGVGGNNRSAFFTASGRVFIVSVDSRVHS